MDQPDLPTLRQNFYWHSQNYHHTRALYLAALNSRRPREEQQQLLSDWQTALDQLDTAMSALLTALEQAEETPRVTQELRRTMQIRDLLHTIRELDPIPDEPNADD